MNLERMVLKVFPVNAEGHLCGKGELSRFNSFGEGDSIKSL